MPGKNIRRIGQGILHVRYQGEIIGVLNGSYREGFTGAVCGKSVVITKDYIRNHPDKNTPYLQYEYRIKYFY